MFIKEMLLVNGVICFIIEKKFLESKMIKGLIFVKNLLIFIVYKNDLIIILIILDRGINNIWN